MGTKRLFLMPNKISFLPTNIDGLQLWLAADLGLSLIDGDPVATWPDQSGNGNDVAQATGAKKPTYKVNIVNGRPVVRFDGIDDWLATSAFSSELSQPNTIFVVVKVTTAEGTTINIYDGLTSTKRHTIAALAAGTPDNVLLYSGFTVNLTVDFPKNAFNLHTVTWNSASTVYRLDGSAESAEDTGTHVLDGLTVGAKNDGTQNLAGDFYAVLVYDKLLNASEINRVERYLANKTGITLS